MLSPAGTALLRELAERVALRAEYSAVLAEPSRRGGGHDPGQVLVDLAVTLADGGEAICDIAALADQPVLHGPVASPATAWRVLAGIDAARLADLRQARALARERAWLARGEVTGRTMPPARAAGRELEFVVLDIDARRIGDAEHQRTDLPVPAALAGCPAADHDLLHPTVLRLDP